MDATTTAGPTRDRFRGALLGLAVGDALGAPAEFMTAEQIRERWGLLTEMVGGGCHGVDPGEPTDPTGMALRLAESLVARETFDPEDVAAAYVDWFRSHPRDVSLTVRTALLAIGSGTPWDRAGRRAYEVLGFPTAGNGSIMRCVPLALRFWREADARRSATLQESMLTHFDHLAGWACVAFNDVVAAALQARLETGIVEAAEALRDEDARVAAVLCEAAGTEPEEIQIAAFVLDTLRAALWAVLQSASFEEALVTVVNLGGDCDTVGAITGALAGARWGEAAIPARWLDALTCRERVERAADGLAELAGA